MQAPRPPPRPRIPTVPSQANRPAEMPIRNDGREPLSSRKGANRETAARARRAAMTARSTSFSAVRGTPKSAGSISSRSLRDTAERGHVFFDDTKVAVSTDP